MQLGSTHSPPYLHWHMHTAKAMLSCSSFLWTTAKFWHGPHTWCLAFGTYFGTYYFTYSIFSVLRLFKMMMLVKILCFRNASRFWQLKKHLSTYLGQSRMFRRYIISLWPLPKFPKANKITITIYNHNHNVVIQCNKMLLNK
jgi:hypothetical protein